MAAIYTELLGAEEPQPGIALVFQSTPARLHCAVRSAPDCSYYTVLLFYSDEIYIPFLPNIFSLGGDTDTVALVCY